MDLLPKRRNVMNRIAIQAVSAAEELNLLTKADRRFDQLTYIEQKRVELARALATRPRVLLLDEWLSGLSPSELDGGISVVWSLAAQGIAVILANVFMGIAAPLLWDHLKPYQRNRLLVFGITGVRCRDLQRRQVVLLEPKVDMEQTIEALP